MIRREMVASMIVFASVIPALFAQPAGDALLYARQNPVLRKYFRTRSLEVLGIRSLRTLESQTDRRIEVFLHDLLQELKDLRQQFYLSEMVRLELVGKDKDTKSRAAGWVKWMQSLKRLSKDAGKVYKQLRFPLGGAIRIPEYRPQIGEWASAQGYYREMEFMARQIREAEQGIRDFLFQPKHSVSVETLGSGDILMPLVRVREMAEEIREKLADEQKRDQASF